jgi:hypothetical protein
MQCAAVKTIPEEIKEPEQKKLLCGFFKSATWKEWWLASTSSPLMISPVSSKKLKIAHLFEFFPYQ